MNEGPPMSIAVIMAVVIFGALLLNLALLVTVLFLAAP